MPSMCYFAAATRLPPAPAGRCGAGGRRARRRLRSAHGDNAPPKSERRELEAHLVWLLTPESSDPLSLLCIVFDRLKGKEARFTGTVEQMTLPLISLLESQSPHGLRPQSCRQRRSAVSPRLPRNSTQARLLK